jgi:HAMP domain-containing protein
MDEVQAAQQAFGQQARLLIIDTLAAATPGLRENTSEDMGRVVSRLRALAETGPWHVMVAHHTGKAAEAGLRGHSSLIGAIDTAIMLERLPAADRGVRAAWERQRDLDSRGFSVTFRVVGAETGVFTNFGRPETAALIEYVAAPLSELEGLGERPRQLLELVQTAIAQQPDQTLDAGGWTTVVEQWELETGLLEGSDNAQRVALKRARASLERAQLLLIDRHAGSGRIRSVRLGDGLFPEAPENG